jgi:hypothetical protein
MKAETSRTGGAGRVAIQRWVARHGVTNDGGQPLKIHRSTIRTTHEAMRDLLRRAATYHPCHPPVWAVFADNTKTFPGELGPTRRAEKARLHP